MSKKISIKDSIALVSGANRGIGKAITEELLNKGIRKVYAGARKLESLTELKEKYGDRLEPIPYLNKNFNLTQLSKEVEIDELEILYYLNEYNEISFNDYLNFLRITFVVEKLKVNYLENHTLSDLARLAGFKSEEHLEEIFRRIMNSSIKSFKSNE